MSMLARALGIEALLMGLVFSPPSGAQEREPGDLEERVGNLERQNRELAEDLERLREALRKTRQGEGSRETPGAGAGPERDQEQEMEASPGGDEDLTLEEISEHLRDIDDRLDWLPTLSGYYDFEYINDDRSGSPGEFRQHHVSVHLSKEIQSFRFFSEIEFEFGTKFKGEGGSRLTEARGEVKLEQAWAEYVHTDFLALRAGLILTPGYWNINHYPNIVLTTRRPLMVRNVFRESFTGVMADGSYYLGGFGFSYEVFLGNGESDFFTKNDDDEGKATGGRVVFHVPVGDLLPRFDLGLRGYYEDKSGAAPVKIWGLEGQAERGPVEVLAEFALGEVPEHRVGLYVQPSYRFLERWAAFYRYDLLRLEDVDRIEEHTIGINFRPIPDVSLKVEVFRSLVSEKLEGYEAGADDYVTKPFDKNELRSKVRVFLRLKSVEEIDRLKSDVFALLSHETRTPLTGIIGPAEMLMSGEEMGIDERRELAGPVHSSARNLQRFFDKVLKLSEIRTGRLELRRAPGRLCEVVREAIGELAERAAERRVEVAEEFSADPTVLVDSAELKGAISALVDNAIRFSPSPGRVTVRVASENGDGLVSVADEGQGIQPEFLPRVFEELGCADVSHQSSGHGLSLAIAREIVRQHDGTIGVESRRDCGATFTVRLPTLES